MNEPAPIRAYVDTSVFGGVYDAEFADHSRAFLLRIQQGEVIALIGEVTDAELTDAPERVRALVRDLPASACVRCQPSSEINTLAAAYMTAQVVGSKWRGDALQVATATVHRADVLVSWNFRHIVRFEKVRAFNAVNLERGYPSLFICSPAEVRYGRKE